MDELFSLIGTAGAPTTVVGICLTIMLFIRKQEAGVRADINGSLARLTAENVAQDVEIVALQSVIDSLRDERRKAQDSETKQWRRAEAAIAKLKELGHDES